VRSNDRWHWLGIALVNNLIQRGTPDATEAIRKIREAFPDQHLDRVERVAEEFIREKTWTPLLPAEFLDLVLAPRRCRSVEASPGDTQSPQPSPPPTVLVKATAEDRLFRKLGDYWELRFGGKPVSVRDSKGMRYIAELLRCPDLDIHVWQLLAAIEGQAEELRLGSAGIILDERTKGQYKTRGEELMQELTQAKRNNDWGRQDEIEMELNQMAEQLSRATGLGARDREASDDVERARKRVSRAIKTAVEAIREHHRKLAGHLDLQVKRGQYCCYRGDGITWQL